ncbi:MAG: tail completion protein gp17, partial [Rhodanobacter sp.]
MESNTAEQWITATLKADAQLTALVGTRIYNTRRPATGAFPCVIFQMQAARDDLMVLGGVRVWAEMLYLVRGIAEQTSYEGNLATIANRIDAALHAKSGVATAGVVWVAVRES